MRFSGAALGLFGLFGAFLVLLALPAGGTRPAAAEAVKVKICHYDRNLQGPNAGPHVIEIDDNAVAQHLSNHVKKEGFEGDDFVIKNDEDLARCVGGEPDTVLFITKECTGGVTGGSFAIEVSGNSIGSITLGCGTTSQAFVVDPGAHLTVHETTTGFDTSYRGACDGDGSVILKAGQENTCVVSNAGVTTLTVTKECGEGVTSADGPFNFTLVGSINDTFSIATCGGEHEVEGVNANDTGVLTETNTGFDVSIRGDCDGDGTLQLIANQDNVCVVHNDPIEEQLETTLIITKECTGGVTGGSFDIDLMGTMSDSFTLGCGTSTDPITVDPSADLTVQETTTGFDTSYRGACDGDGSVILVEGEENTCVVSNAGLITLTITKECGDGVTDADGPFNFTLTGTINDTFSIATCGGEHEVVGVNEDDTGVLAETNTGFDVSIRGDCDGDGSLQLIANDDNVCVVRNELPGVEETGSLTITKACVPSDDTGQFAIMLDGEEQDTVGCGGSVTAIDLAPGTYTVSEAGANGTDLTDYTTSIGGDCDSTGDVTIDAGDDLTCTITNELNIVIVVQPTPEVTAVPPAALVEATAVPTAEPPAAPVEIVEAAAPTTVPSEAAVAGVTSLPSTGSGGPDQAGGISIWLLTGLLAGLGGLALLSSRVIRP